jgi:TrmH family RNA methyltransferase
MVITSPQNPKLQLIRSLIEKRKEREGQQLFVVEGVRLAEEAFHSNWPVELVLFSDELSERGRHLIEEFQQQSIETQEVASSLLRSISDTESPQGMTAVIRRKDLPLPDRLDFVVVADAVRDPGNLGTMLRTCAAAGVQAVLLAPGTVDAFSPKVVRSAMGAHFRLPILERTWSKIAGLCTGSKPPIQLLASDAECGTEFWSTDLKRPVALVIGGEAEGVTPEAAKLMDGWIQIPMPGSSESLNAAVAASILIFEVVRQRCS